MNSPRMLRSWLLRLLLLVPCAAHAAPDDAPTLTIDEISCRGNVVTTCDFILGHLYLAAGEVLDEIEIGNARLRLMSLPSFQSVDIYLEKGVARDRVRVVIEVAEADPYVREWLSGTSWRIGSLSQLLAGRLTNQNVFGTDKLVDVSLLAYQPISGRIRGEYAARAQYVDPHWRGSKRIEELRHVYASRDLVRRSIFDSLRIYFARSSWRCAAAWSTRCSKSGCV